MQKLTDPITGLLDPITGLPDASGDCFETMQEEAECKTFTISILITHFSLRAPPVRIPAIPQEGGHTS